MLALDRSTVPWLHASGCAVLLSEYRNAALDSRYPDGMEKRCHRLCYVGFQLPGEFGIGGILLRYGEISRWRDGLAGGGGVRD